MSEFERAAQTALGMNKGVLYRDGPNECFVVPEALAEPPFERDGLLYLGVIDGVHLWRRSPSTLFNELV